MPTKVIEEIEKLYGSDFSLIPVRDKEEVTSEGKIMPPKTPYYGWKKWQEEAMPLDCLCNQLIKKKTNAIAIICGRVSRNLEVIDVDSKYKPGIDTLLFADIARTLPHIFPRLRIHRTPSGGYHIFFRIAEGEVPSEITKGFPRNKKLAGYRDETGKQINFLETRGEGGYVLAPPSMGYVVHQDVPVPVLTWKQRCSLIARCESYNEIGKGEKTSKVAYSNKDLYSECPYEHFAASDRAAEVLINNGWNAEGERSPYLYFTRPDKLKGISASFHKEKRFFYFFTSSTVFEPNKGYSPGTVLAILEHGGDHEAAFKRLVDDGYGKIRSSEGAIAQLQGKYPLGTFWEYKKHDTIRINRQKLLEVAEGLGFRLHLGMPVRIVGYKVLQQEVMEVYNTLKAYIQEEDINEYKAICDIYEAFLQKSGKFTLTRLPRLDETLLLQSTAFISYKLYLNGYLEIKSDSFQLHPYQELGEKLVWEASILKRDFIYRADYDKSHYYHFLHNATGISEHLKQVIGYYAHDYKDETMGYIGIMVEQVANPEEGGGVGKNVFASLLGLTTTIRSIPGSQADWSDKLLSTWNMERIFSISDAPQRTDYAFLKELATGVGSFKRLFKDPVIVPCRLMPKFLISTNFSFILNDGGLKRRIIPIEFTDYYSKNGGVDKVHGGHFPNDWDEEEYQWFDNVILIAVQSFLRAGCKLTAPNLTETGWEKQFKQTHGEMTWNFIKENWENWLQQTYIAVSVFNRVYESFCSENNVCGRYRKNKLQLNKAITEYARRHNVQYNPSKQIRSGGKPIKHQVFEVSLGT